MGVAGLLLGDARRVELGLDLEKPQLRVVPPEGRELGSDAAYLWLAGGVRLLLVELGAQVIALLGELADDGVLLLRDLQHMFDPFHERRDQVRIPVLVLHGGLGSRWSAVQGQTKSLAMRAAGGELGAAEAKSTEVTSIR